MNFKYWFILSEELYQNNTATIFHRTSSFERVQGMMNGGFTAGGGAFHGPGLYTTYTLEGTTNLGYGPYVIKLKVKNLKSYFVFEPDVAKQIHGNNWKLKDQARILELTLKLTDEQWQKYQKISESGKFGSAAASKALIEDGYFLWYHGCKGIVYNGENDGKCICVYAPYEGLQFLAYAHAPTPTTVDFIEKNWVKSGKDVSIRSISDLKFPKGTGIGSTSVEKQYEIEKEKNIPSKILKQIYDDLKIGKYVKLKFYLNRNKLSDEDIHNLLEVARNKNEMINFIIKNKTELSSKNVYDLLAYASDKDRIARILGPDNINKLNSEDVYHLLNYADDKEKMINFIIKYKTELSNVDISILLDYTPYKEKMAEILGPNNINKLNNDNVYDFLMGASDKEKMVRILGPDKLSKLNVDQVTNLIYYTSDKDKMANILGSENINKIIDDGDPAYIYWLFGDQEPNEGKEKMKQFLRKYYTGTNPEVISSFNQ